MPDTSPVQPANRILRAGLWFGLVSLALSLALVVVEQLEFFFNGKVGSSLTLEALATSPDLAFAVGWWLAAVLAVYAGAGLLVARLYLQSLRLLPVQPRDAVALSVLVQIAVAGWALLFNARLYPNSLFARGFVDWASSMPATVGFWLLTAALAVAGSVAAVSMIAGWLRAPASRGRRGVALVLVALPVGLAIHGMVGDAARPAAEGQSRPNVVIVGIDSLRPDHLAYNGFPLDLTPRIDAFLAGAIVYEDTLTPLARTFPAWMSILTGREPVSHGARFNLVPDAATAGVRASNLARWLGSRGYRTVFATDERRFSNIDEGFGFDTVIAPPMGAADFLIGGLNDLPLANLAGRTAAGRWLFPYSYGNRAAAATYRPESFVAMLEDDLDAGSGRPVFLAAHLCLPHWPFIWAARAGAPQPALPAAYEDTRAEYLDTLAAVDRQFAEVMALLARRGVLDDAIVVVLSDHGESFSMARDVLQPGADSGFSRPLNEVAGHGTSVSALSQHQVVLAMRRYGTEPTLPGRSGIAASLIDVAPTLVDLLGLDPPGVPFDGASLVGPGDLSRRAFAVESGFSIPAMMQLIPDLKETIRESARFYTVDRRGRLTIDEQYLEGLVRSKQRAVVMGEWMMTVDRRGNGRLARQLVQRHERRIWDENTLAASGAPVAELTAAFCLRYGDDVGVRGEALCAAPATTAAADP